MEPPVMTAHESAAPERGGSVDRLAAWVRTERGLVRAAVLMVLVHLAVRIWAISQSWFRMDDLQILARLKSEGLSVGTAFEPWAGHLVVFNWVLPWLTMHVADPLSFTLPAVEVLVLTAILDAGCVVFLVSAFGRRPGVLVPLALFLFSTVDFPSFMWLTSATNKTPVLIAIFWGGWAHLKYLRSRQLKWAVLTAAITLVGLICFEKTLYAFVLYAFLALGYFTTGGLVDRLHQLVSRYRAGVVCHSVLAVGYLAFYVTSVLNFNPGESSRQPLAELAWDSALTNGAGLVGGPFTWDFSATLEGQAVPGDLVGMVSLAVIAAVIVHLASTRERSKRAWLLPGIFFAADVVLLAGTRANLTGPGFVGSMYRYFTEVSAGAAIALGLASMPLLGAVESATLRPGARPLAASRVVAATLAMSLLATYSTVQFVRDRHATATEKAFYDHLRRSIPQLEKPVEVLDTPVPSSVLWGAAFPYNMASKQIPLVSDVPRFTDVASNRLYMVSPSGDLRPVVVSAVRRAASSPDGDARCPHPAADGSLTLSLDGPVVGFGWVVRLAYVASADSPVHIEAGDLRYETTLEKGLHNLFFRAEGQQFQTITLTDLDPSASVCVTDAVLGTPQAASGS